MSSRIAALRPLRPLSIAASLLFAASQTARAGVIVQYGDYLSPTATLATMPFQISYNFPLFADHELYDYSPSPFQAAGAGQPIEITAFSFFANTPIRFSNLANVYDVFLSTGSGPKSFFGHFEFPNAPFCGANGHGCLNVDCFVVSPTCDPTGVGAIGSYLYDPARGGLQVELVETVDRAGSFAAPAFYVDQYASGGRGIVTRFAGAVVVTPEPSSLSLVAFGVLCIAGGLARRRITRR